MCYSLLQNQQIVAPHRQKRQYYPILEMQHVLRDPAHEHLWRQQLTYVRAPERRPGAHLRGLVLSALQMEGRHAPWVYGLQGRHDEPATKHVFQYGRRQKENTENDHQGRIQADSGRRSCQID